MITDPIETVSRVERLAVAIGLLTMITATIGINIVANFVSPAFDFSNCSPQKNQLPHRRHDRRGRLHCAHRHGTCFNSPS